MNVLPFELMSFGVESIIVTPLFLVVHGTSFPCVPGNSLIPPSCTLSFRIYLFSSRKRVLKWRNVCSFRAHWRGSPLKMNTLCTFNDERDFMFHHSFELRICSLNQKAGDERVAMWCLMLKGLAGRELAVWPSMD